MNLKLLDTSKHLVLEFEKTEIVDSISFSTSILLPLSELFNHIISIKPAFVDYEDVQISVDSKAVFQRLKIIFEGDCTYNQVFDPLDDNEFVTFSLVNDLVEIYEGLKEFLHFSKVNPSAAEWVFQENFRSHLHQHILNSMKVLYMGFKKDN